MQQEQMQQQPRVSQQQMKAVYNLVEQYKQNPSAFSNDEIAEIKQYADSMGIPMEVNTSMGRALGNLAFNAADTALFGILPESWKPAAITGVEKAAEAAGGLLGMVGPFALGGKVASAGAKGIGKLANLAKGELAGDVLGMSAAQGNKLARLLTDTKAGQAIANQLDNVVTSQIGQQTLQKLMANPKALKLALQLGTVGGTNNFFEEGPSPIDALLYAGAGAGMGMYGGSLPMVGKYFQ